MKVARTDWSKVLESLGGIKNIERIYRLTGSSDYKEAVRRIAGWRSSLKHAHGVEADRICNEARVFFQKLKAKNPELHAALHFNIKRIEQQAHISIFGKEVIFD